jgi:hypothetical protein
MMRAPIDLRPNDETLCAFLESLLPEVLRQLAMPTWHGFANAEPDDPQAQRARLEHAARLNVKGSGRVFAVAVHLFETIGGETRLHDHRYPLAVFPFAAVHAGDGPLYEMQWIEQTSSQRSVVPVHNGQLWAVAEPSRIQHTVRSLRPHASVVLSDVTAAATRPARLLTTALPPAEITRVRELVRGALARALQGAHPHDGPPTERGAHAYDGPDLDD